MLQTVRNFLEQFFKCHYCRQHFLKNYEAGSFGRDLARASREEASLTAETARPCNSAYLFLNHICYYVMCAYCVCEGACRNPTT